jgi:hypothetical protein
MADIIFIHAPNFSGHYPLLGRLVSVNTMPAGLLGLADIAAGAGLTPLVMHLGVEKLANPGFSMTSALKRERPALVGIALHFHPQSCDAIKSLRAARKALPGAFIFLGGFTASFFAEEILREFPEADAVLRGEAEEAVRMLCVSGASRGSILPDIPGLSYRKDGRIFHNPAKPAETGSVPPFSRTRLELMLHGDIYARLAQDLYFYKPGWGLETNLRLFGNSVGFPLPLFRGCQFSCEYCGGGRAAQERLCGRRRMDFLPVEEVLKEMRQLRAWGVIHVFFEYAPLGDRDAYYAELFGRMRSEGLSPDMNIECRVLPSEIFLTAFAACSPGNKSRLVFSPETIHNEARLKIKHGAHMTYGELLTALGRMEQLHIASEIFFTPQGTKEEPAELTSEIQRLRAAFPHLKSIQVNKVELDPCSPLYLRKENAPGLSDYVAYHSGSGADTGIGWDRDSLCKEFCALELKHSWRLPKLLRTAAGGAARAVCRLARKCWEPPGRDIFPY